MEPIAAPNLPPEALFSEDSVYRFTLAREYLAHVLQAKQKRNPRFSIRAWSRQLGFKSPSFLASILRGERSLRPRVASGIVRTLGLKDNEKRYFELLVMLSNAETPEEREIYEGLMNALRPQHRYADLALEKFRLIADWYHSALLEMPLLADFRPDLDYLSERLGPDCSPALLAEAVGRLRHLGLLAVDADGKWRRVRGEPKSGDAAPSQAVRNHHLQMIEKARQALGEQKVTERTFRGSTVAIRKQDYARAEKLIQDFHRAMHRLEAKGDAEHVYRLNTQFFRLTRASSGKGEGA